MRLKKDLIEKMKGNTGLKRQVIKLLGISQPTMWRYLEENSDNLTKMAVLKLVAQHYNLTIEETLETPKTEPKVKP